MTAPSVSLSRARALLGLGDDPTRREIVQAFRRRARAVHPDVSAASDATDRFTEVSTAYRLVLAHVDDPRAVEACFPTAHRVAVRYVPSAPPVDPTGTPVRTSPLVWVGPPTVVSASGSRRDGAVNPASSPQVGGVTRTGWPVGREGFLRHWPLVVIGGT